MGVAMLLGDGPVTPNVAKIFVAGPTSGLVKPAIPDLTTCPGGMEERGAADFDLITPGAGFVKEPYP